MDVIPEFYKALGKLEALSPVPGWMFSRPVGEERDAVWDAPTQHMDSQFIFEPAQDHPHSIVDVARMYHWVQERTWYEIVSNVTVGGFMVKLPRWVDGRGVFASGRWGIKEGNILGHVAGWQQACHAAHQRAMMFEGRPLHPPMDRQEAVVVVPAEWGVRPGPLDFSVGGVTLVETQRLRNVGLVLWDLTSPPGVGVGPATHDHQSRTGSVFGRMPVQSRVAPAAVAVVPLSGMRRRTYWVGRWRLRVWLCCGLEWQLVLHRRWPDRARWGGPTCPRCGDRF